MLLLLVALLGVGTVGASPASAAACPPPAPVPNSLTITQTSVITGLSPTTGAVGIFGTVTNNSDEEARLDDIEVSIVGVTLAAGAAAGTCTAADYELFDAVMPVDVMLAARATTGFSGASIGFVDTAENQDACQGATVLLEYVTVSSPLVP